MPPVEFGENSLLIGLRLFGDTIGQSGMSDRLRSYLDVSELTDFI